MNIALTPLTAADLGLPPPQAVSAALPLFVVALLTFKRRLPRVAASVALLAGTALTDGWIYEGIHFVVEWATRGINLVTTSTVGGVVPGALAIILLLYYVVELWPDPEMLDTVVGIFDGRRPSRPAGGGQSRYAHRHGTSRYAGRHDRAPAASARIAGLGVRPPAAPARPSKGRPEKLGAVAVGLALPSVVTTIPGTVGAVALSAVNVAGGLVAWPLARGFGA